MVSFCFRDDYDGNKDAKGFVTSSAGRGPIAVFDATFSVVGFTEVAISLADCNARILNGSIAVSSAVSILLTIEGVLSPILSPLFGGLADTTPYRKLYLGIGLIFLILSTFMQGAFYLSEETDKPDPNNDGENLFRPLLYSDASLVALGATILFNVLIYELVSLLTISYAPELTKDEVKQMGFISDSYAANNGSQLFYLLIALGIGIVLGFNTFQQAALAAFIVGVYAGVVSLLGYLQLGGRRDIDHELDKRCFGAFHLLKAGFRGFFKYTEVAKFLLSWMFVAGAVQSSVGLATNYLRLYLGYDGTTINALVGMALLMSVPGSLLSRVWVKSFGFHPKNVYIAVALIYAFTFLLTPVLLISERTEPTNGTFSIFGQCDTFSVEDGVSFSAPDYVFYLTVIFLLVYGLMLGHVYPLNVQIYALLIPGGEENTFYGIKVTFSKLLGWLPPAIFTLLSENNDGDVRLAFIPQGVMFLAGAAFCAAINIQKGADDIKDTLSRRQGVYKLDPAGEVDNFGLLVEEKDEVKKKLQSEI